MFSRICNKNKGSQVFQVNTFAPIESICMLITLDKGLRIESFSKDQGGDYLAKISARVLKEIMLKLKWQFQFHWKWFLKLG